MSRSKHPDHRESLAREVRDLRNALYTKTRAHARAVKELQESRAHSTLLDDSLKDYAVFVLDPMGQIQSWNAGAERLYGYPGSESIGQNFSIFYSAEDRACGVPQHLLTLATTEGRVEQEGWRVRKDGSRFRALVTITALRDRQGQLVGFGKVTRDLTEHRAFAEALQRSEEHFRLFVESVQDYAIFMLSPSGHVTSWNAGAQRFKGYREDEIVGQHFSVFYPAEDREAGKPLAALETAAREGHYEDLGWRLRKDGTPFWADVVITALRDTEGRLVGFGKVTRDLTPMRLAEEARLQLAEERAARQLVEQAGRQREEFLGVAAHELKTPVTSLLLQTQLTVRRLTKGPAFDVEGVLRSLATIEAQARKLSQLVNTLLDLSQISSGQLFLNRSDADVVVLAAEVVSLFRILAPDRAIDIVAPESLITSIDSPKLEQILATLLGNAVKYSQTGSIQVRITTAESRFQIVVSDEGPGIPESKRETIFEGFGPVDARNYWDGLGVGLAFSRQIAWLHGGDLIAEFPTSGGSQFVVSLPLMSNGE